MLFVVWVLSSMNREMEYDGIVLESWSRWAAHGILHDPDLRNMVIITLIDVSSLLKLYNSGS